ncbi:MAG: hypothetical protein JW997_06370 [Actinobacteria bacterium]|nr:hypothetical protein [Actinomycetota bacterium]
MRLKVAVLGAGYMGSAITFPLADKNNEINLWGTWLDDEIIESSIKGFHPKLKLKLLKNVNLYYWQDLQAALDDVDIIFIAVASEGFVNVFEKLIDSLRSDKDYIFLKLTKGFVQYNGKIVRATQAAKDLFKKKFPGKEFNIASIGGPVRALDLANRIPSASMYGISDPKLGKLQKLLSTDYYRVFTNIDAKGVELCSAFKNIYAMAAGICDGLYRSEKEGLYHNIVAFLFNQACLEIAKIVKAAGGRESTAFNLAGIGDLHVTSAAGRNRRYGEMVGKGMDGEKAFKKMLEEGEYGEGYMALKLAIPWLKQENPVLLEELTLLTCLNNIIFNKAKPFQEFEELILNINLKQEAS